MKISLHELKHNIDVFELPGTGWQHDMLDLHNVCRVYLGKLAAAAAMIKNSSTEKVKQTSRKCLAVPYLDASTDAAA